MLPANLDKSLSIVTISLFIACSLVFSIRSFGPDELYFLHHTWTHSHNVGINKYEVYPFPLLISLLSIIYKNFGLMFFAAWKPILATLYLVVFYLLARNKDHKWVYAYLLMVLMLNRGIEIRPEPLATLAILYSLLISEKNFGNISHISKLFFLLIATAFSPRYLPITFTLLVYSLHINQQFKKRWFFNLGIAISVVIATYFFLVGNPFDSIQYLVSRQDLRENFDLKYKFDRLFGNGYLLKIIVVYYLINFISKLVMKRIQPIDIYYQLGLILQILYIITFDKVPYEYVAQTLVLFIIWYFHSSYTDENSFSIAKNQKINLIIFLMVILAITIEIKKNRDFFKNSLTTISASTAITTDQLLLTKNLTPYTQLSGRVAFCNQYLNYSCFTNNYRFHPICMPDEYSIKIGRLQMTEEAIQQLINKKNGVVSFKNNTNGIYLYPHN